MSYVSLQRGGVESGLVEHDVERNVGHLSGPWYGRLGRLSSEHELLDVERRTRWSLSSSHLISVHVQAKASSIVEQLNFVRSL